MKRPASDDPPTVGFLAFLRKQERRAQGKPRVGENTTLRQESLVIGQDPFMAFPAADLSRLGERRGKPEIRTNVLGFFGPHGALPLNMTEEALRWANSGDLAFVEFTDIFATRFQQLFYRAWANARAITQFDHPEGDRFADYLGALVGIGNPANKDRDALEDVNKLALAPLATGRVKSPVRLRQMLRQDLNADVEVEEHIPTWIVFEPDTRNALGARGSSLGRDLFLGARVQSVDEKVRLHVRTQSLAEYRSFLPGGVAHGRLRDIVHWYLGAAFDVDVSLTLPADQMQPAQIGKSTELGWMAALEPTYPPPPRQQVQGATYPLTQSA